MIILYPEDYIDFGKPDSCFRNEASVFKDAGFDIVVLSEDDSITRRRLKKYSGEKMLYRGWMKTPDEYLIFEQLCSDCSISLVTSKESYSSSHHISGWLPKIEDLTFETKLFQSNSDMVFELRELGWDNFFIKDYVKSLKSGYKSVLNSPEEFEVFLKDFLLYVGEPQGGWAVRRVANIIKNSERRFFIFNGQPYSSTPDEKIPNIIYEACERYHLSNFWSIDICEIDTGEVKVVEIGDGQVSDLVGWSPELFVKIFNGQ